jgi:hypothetical protein
VFLLFGERSVSIALLYFAGCFADKMSKKQGKSKGVKLSLNDFLTSGGPGAVGAWADDEPEPGMEKCFGPFLIMAIWCIHYSASAGVYAP